jgi:hypothetical protein
MHCELPARDFQGHAENRLPNLLAAVAHSFRFSDATVNLTHSLAALPFEGADE